MADSFIPIQSVTADQKADTEQLTVGANTVQRERVEIAGAAAAELARVENGAPGSTDYGLVVRNIPSGTQAVSGTVTANAGTNLNTSALALDSTVAKDSSLTTIDTDIKAAQPRKIQDSSGGSITVGQKAMAASVPVVLASDQPAISVSSSAANAPTRSDTYTILASGTSVTALTGVKSFAIQVKGTNSAATTWDVRLEGSLDNVNFSTILQHTNVTGDGAVLWSGATLSPVLYFRSRCAGLVLGAATNIVVTILGLP